MFKENRKKTEVHIAICLLLFRIFLDYSYFTIIVKAYGYYGFTDNRSLQKGIISYLFLVCFMILIAQIAKSDRKRFSSIVVFVIAIFTVVPYTTLIYAGVTTIRLDIQFFIYWLLIILLQLMFERRPLKTIQIKVGKYYPNDKLAVCFGILSMALVIFVSYKYTHFRLNFNLFAVYSLREEASTYNLPIVLDYMFCWTRALNNVLLAYSITKKKYSLGILFFVSQMLSFGIDGLKSTFFMPFVVIIVCLFYKTDSFRKYKSLLVMGITGITFLGCLEKIVHGSNLITTIIVRRLLIIPTYLGVCYMDFFSKNTPDYYRMSILRHFGFNTPYPHIGEIIGSQYFNTSKMNCNNGMISDAVTNMGTFGVIIMPLILIMVLRFLDSCTSNLNEKIFISTAIYVAILLMNSFLFTALMTHGLLVVALVLYMMNMSRSNLLKIEMQ